MVATLANCRIPWALEFISIGTEDPAPLPGGVLIYSIGLYVLRSSSRKLLTVSRSVTTSENPCSTAVLRAVWRAHSLNLSWFMTTTSLEDCEKGAADSRSGRMRDGQYWAARALRL